MYPVSCPRKIQIWKLGIFRCFVAMDEHFVMADGGYWNEIEFELYQASCLMEVAVTKE
jgi:hypothetical protein